MNKVFMTNRPIDWMIMKSRIKYRILIEASLLKILSQENHHVHSLRKKASLFLICNMASYTEGPLWWDWGSWNAEVFECQLVEGRIPWAVLSPPLKRVLCKWILTNILWGLYFGPFSSGDGGLVLRVGLTTSSNSSISMCSLQYYFTEGSLPSGLLPSSAVRIATSSLSVRNSTSLFSSSLRKTKKRLLKRGSRKAVFVIIPRMLSVYLQIKENGLFQCCHHLGIRCQWWLQLLVKGSWRRGWMVEMVTHFSAPSCTSAYFGWCRSAYSFSRR